MRLIIYIVIFYLIYSLIKKVLQGRRENSSSGLTVDPANSESEVVTDEVIDTAQDPVCSSFIEKDSAKMVKDGADLYYFCSEDCRQKFLSDKDA